MTDLPLKGKKILVTRAAKQAYPLSQKLRELGAEPVEFPLLRFTPPENIQPVKQAIELLFAGKYDYVVFTSANAVEFFLQHLQNFSYETSILNKVKIVAVGEATASTLIRNGLQVNAIPQRYLTEEIPTAICKVSGQRILLARSNLAKRTLADILKAKGAVVDEIAVYWTLPTDAGTEELQKILENKIDFITFTSASCVRYFAELLMGLDISKILDNIKIVCIGPVTADAVRNAGMKPHLIAKEHTIQGLINSIIEEVKKYA